MPLKLYQSDLSPYATRVRILAHAKGLKMECVAPPGGSLKSAEYLAINPLGRIPCLEHDGALIPESEVICEYLEDSFPTPTLRPVDPQARARARLLARMSDLYLAPQFTKLVGQLNPKTRDESVVRQVTSDLETIIGTMTNFIDGPDYAVGERLSLADCALIPFFFFIEQLFTSTFDRESPLKGSMKLYYDNAQKDAHIARAVNEMKAAMAEQTRQAGR
jgi:glutathione S-transferase